MTDIPNRLQIKIDTASAFAAADYEGQPGIESSYYAWRYYAGGIPRYSCPGDITGACKATRVYVGGVECISPTRAGYFTSLWLPAAISGQILRAGAGGEIVNSSLSEDSSSINSAKPMTLNGAMTAAGGLGVFGVTPPTTRPTVNDACTDLATCIALTNQLRTHLIACGLVQ